MTRTSRPSYRRTEMSTRQPPMPMLRVRWASVMLIFVLLLLPTTGWSQEGEDVDPDAATSDPWAPSKRTVPEMTFAMGDWTTQLTGYIRTTLTFIGIEGDESPDFIGENNGFAMLDARLAVVVRYLEYFEIVLQVDGAADSRTDVNSVTGRQVVALKDAYGAYMPGPWFWLLVGQYKPPVDLETILSTRDLT